jgi:hypothetical protein
MAKAGPAGESGRAFTSKECGSDSDRIMKQAPWRSGQSDAVERPAADRFMSASSARIVSE